MVRLFYSNRSVGLLFLPFIMAGLVFCNMLTGYHQPELSANFGFWGSVLEQEKTYSQIVAPTLIYINAVLLNLVFNRNDFLEKNTFLPSLLYASFLSYFHGFYFLNGFAVAQTFVVLSLLQLFRLNQNEDGRRVVFNAAFFLGVASTFYPFMIIAFPFMFWMIWVIRPFIFRESIIALFGYIIPFLYAGVFNYMIGHRLGSEEFSSSSFEFKKIDMIFLFSVLFILAVLSLQGISRKFQKSSIRLKKLFRKTFLMISFISTLSALEYLFFRKIEPISLLFIPLTFVIPFGFGEKEPKTLPSLLYYVLIIFAFGKFFIPLNQ